MQRGGTQGLSLVEEKFKSKEATGEKTTSPTNVKLLPRAENTPATCNVV